MCCCRVLCSSHCDGATSPNRLILSRGRASPGPRPSSTHPPTRRQTPHWQVHSGKTTTLNLTQFHYLHSVCMILSHFLSFIHSFQCSEWKHASRIIITIHSASLSYHYVCIYANVSHEFTCACYFHSQHTRVYSNHNNKVSSVLCGLPCYRGHITLLCECLL